MNAIIFPESLFAHMSEKLWVNSTLETAAVVLMNAAVTTNSTKLLVREVILVPPEAYEVRTPSRLQINSVFIARITKRARNENQLLGFVHTHPFDLSDAPQFSKIDDVGEQTLAQFLFGRTGETLHASIVLSRNGVSARILGKDTPLSVRTVGASIRTIDDQILTATMAERYERQVRAFGKEGQQLLSSLRVGVVGVGGTGSAVIQSLALLGVSCFSVIDPDTVSETNLNRLIGASHKDVNLPKTQVSERVIKSIQPDAQIKSVQGDVTSKNVAEKLLDCDIIFSCTDSHGSRATLNQIAYQYLIPVIDMGVSINVVNGSIKNITGRVQMLSPGLGCLVCGNLLDSNKVRWDYMSERDRKSDPYFIGDGEPAPSVVTLNTTVVSLAVSMFLSATTGVPMHARTQIYDGIRGTVRAVNVPQIGGCVMCSTFGMLARGDASPLPGREDHDGIPRSE